MSWKILSKDAYTAAQATKRHPRSCISRAYYAAYSGVADVLCRTRGIAFAPDRDGPSHAGLPKLVDRIAAWPQRTRRDVKAAIRRLYAARLGSDYQPYQTVMEKDAVNALMDAKMILQVTRTL